MLILMLIALVELKNLKKDPEAYSFAGLNYIFDLRFQDIHQFH